MPRKKKKPARQKKKPDLMVRGLVGSLVALCFCLATPMKAQTAPNLDQAQQLLDQGRADEARAQLDRWIKKRSKDARAFLLRSNALFLLGEAERGTADLDRALALDPTLRQGWLNRAALAMADQQYDQALTALRRAQQLDPAAPDNEINIGAALLLKGDLTQAARSFQRYLDLHRTSAEGHYLVATNYALAGYVAPAVDLLRRAIQLDERSRLQARTDPNFAAISAELAYQRLLAQDPQRPERGSHVARFLFARPYEGGKAELLPAVLDSLQAAEVAFDRQVEVTEVWALVWGEIRVEIRDSSDGRGLVQLSAAPNSMTAATWKRRSDDLVRRIQSRLVTLMAAKRKAQAQKRPPSQ